MSNLHPSPIERRPLAARSWGISKELSRRLANTGISPNQISVAGMIAAIMGGGLFAMTPIAGPMERWLWLGAGILILIRGLANMLDGMVAIESNRTSKIGELFNEIPDRVSDSALLIGIGFATASNPIWGCLAALTAVFTAYIRAICKVAGAPQNYCGPMAKIQRMMILWIICAMGTIEPEWLSSIPIGFPTIALIIIVFGCLITSIRRIHIATRFLHQSS